MCRTSSKVVPLRPQPQLERLDSTPTIGLERRSTLPVSPKPAVVGPRLVLCHFYSEKSVIFCRRLLIAVQSNNDKKANAQQKKTKKKEEEE